MKVCLRLLSPAHILNDSLPARIVLFFRSGTVGTAVKDYASFSWLRHGYTSDLEPLDPLFQPNEHDLKSAKRNNCLPLADRKLLPGPLHAAVRGKAMVVAAGYVSADCVINIVLDSNPPSSARSDYQFWS